MWVFEMQMNCLYNTPPPLFTPSLSLFYVSRVLSPGPNCHPLHIPKGGSPSSRTFASILEGLKTSYGLFTLCPISYSHSTLCKDLVVAECINPYAFSGSCGFWAVRRASLMIASCSMSSMSFNIVKRFQRIVSIHPHLQGH